MGGLISKEKLLRSFHDIRWKTVKDNRTQVPLTAETYVPWKDVAKRIIQQPTVEAIPIEEVARMFFNFTNGSNICIYDISREIDDWCREHCCEQISLDCWIHAIKEGWLDDVRNT